MTDPGQQTDPRATVCMILFVAGDEANSRRARENLSRLCAEELKGDCELRVVDVLLDFQQAIEHNVMVTPTLIVTDPQPGVTLIGDLRDIWKLRAALRLAEAERI